MNYPASIPWRGHSSSGPKVGLSELMSQVQPSRCALAGKFHPWKKLTQVKSPLPSTVRRSRLVRYSAGVRGYHWTQVGALLFLACDDCGHYFRVQEMKRRG